MAIDGWRSVSVVLFAALACAGLCRWLADDLPPVRNVEGFTAQGFKRAAEAFRLLLLSGEERGAAFAASYDGRLVVDLWGGYADWDAWRAWRKETVSRTFLTTYAAAVASVLLLADRQEVDLGRPVASYWPEFAANGKQDVTVAQLLRREVLVAPPETPVRLSQLPLDGRGKWPQAGSPAARSQDGGSGSATAFDLSALLGDRPLVNDSVAAAAVGSGRQMQQQQLELLELYMDQLVRRTDRRFRGLAEFALDEIIRPHGLSCYVGLPVDALPNATRLLLPRRWQHGRSGSMAALVDLLLAPGDLLCRLARFLAGLGGAGDGGGSDERRPTVYDLASPAQLNDFDVQKRPVLSVNGFATARSLVRLYELLTGVGGKPGGSGGGGARLLSASASALLVSPAAAAAVGAAAAAGSMAAEGLSLSSWYDWWPGSGRTDVTIAGLLLQRDIAAANGTVYVGVGDGGQYVLVDPKNNLVMAYLTSQLSGHSAGLDPRFQTVLKAVYGCLPKS